jgi:hypothetical protein
MSKRKIEDALSFGDLYDFTTEQLVEEAVRIHGTDDIAKFGANPKKHEVAEYIFLKRNKVTRADPTALDLLGNTDFKSICKPQPSELLELVWDRQPPGRDPFQADGDRRSSRRRRAKGAFRKRSH